MHAPLHILLGSPQQMPDWHVCPATHAFPHPPQSVFDLVVSTQPSEHAWMPGVVGHPKAQWPDEHTGVAPPASGAVQTTPQPPQFCRSDEVSTQPAPGHCVCWPGQTDAQ
jgi:hypothetical protein